MDKYTYNLKVEKIQSLVRQGDFESAARIADTMDFGQEHNVRFLETVADAYENTKQYTSAIDILLRAYQNAAIGKRIMYRLCELALKAGQIADAETFYKKYLEEAPDENNRYILRYEIAEYKGEDIDRRIQILETYRKYEFEEKWAYRLAELYQIAGRKDECVALCDEIILWFGVGAYVEKAMKLKEQFEPLTAEQEEHRENRAFYEARVQAVADEMAEAAQSSEAASGRNGETAKPGIEDAPEDEAAPVEKNDFENGELPSIALSSEVASAAIGDTGKIELAENTEAEAPAAQGEIHAEGSTAQGTPGTETADEISAPETPGTAPADTLSAPEEDVPSSAETQRREETAEGRQDDPEAATMMAEAESRVAEAALKSPEERDAVAALAAAVQEFEEDDSSETASAQPAPETPAAGNTENVGKPEKAGNPENTDSTGSLFDALRAVIPKARKQEVPKHRSYESPKKTEQPAADSSAGAEEKTATEHEEANLSESSEPAAERPEANLSESSEPAAERPEANLSGSSEPAAEGPEENLSGSSEPAAERPEAKVSDPEAESRVKAEPESENGHAAEADTTATAEPEDTPADEPASVAETENDSEENAAVTEAENTENPETEAVTEAEAVAAAESEDHSETEPDSEAEAGTGTNNAENPEVKADPEAGADAEVNSEENPEAETVTATDNAENPEAEAVTKTSADAETESEENPGTEAVTETSADAETGSAENPETKAVTETEAGAGAENAAEAVPEPADEPVAETTRRIPPVSQGSQDTTKNLRNILRDTIGTVGSKPLPPEPEKDDEPLDTPFETEGAAPEGGDGSLQDANVLPVISYEETERAVWEDQARRRNEIEPLESHEMEHCIFISATSTDEGINKAIEALDNYYHAHDMEVGQIAKILGEKLNHRGLRRSLPQLGSKDLIIDKAGALSDDMITELLEVMEHDDPDKVFVLLDTPEEVEKLKKRVRAMIRTPDAEAGASAQASPAQAASAQQSAAPAQDRPQASEPDQPRERKPVRKVHKLNFERIDAHQELSEKDFIRYADYYANEIECVIDDSGFEALESELDNIRREDGVLTAGEVREIVEDAAEHANKPTIKRMFSSKYDKEGYLILRRRDFI